MPKTLGLEEERESSAAGPSATRIWNHLISIKWCKIITTQKGNNNEYEKFSALIYIQIIRDIHILALVIKELDRNKFDENKF